VDKIYSRKRIRIPKLVYLYKFPKLKDLRKKKLIKLYFIVFIIFAIIMQIFHIITPIIDVLCIDETKSLATIISNEQATEVMKKYEYEDIITIYRDKNDNIVMLKSNIISINKIISDVATCIQNKINNTNSDDLWIRLGTMTGSKILSGRGPKIPIKVSTVGSVDTELKSEFKTAGINQTLHRVYLEVKCNVSILTPFHTIQEQITNQVIIAENVILGIVPSTYYNLEGMKEDDVTEVLE